MPHSAAARTRVHTRLYLGDAVTDIIFHLRDLLLVRVYRLQARRTEVGAHLLDGLQEPASRQRQGTHGAA